MYLGASASAFASASASTKTFLSPLPSSSSYGNTPSLLSFSSASNPHRPLSISAVHVAKPAKEPPASSVTSPLATTAKWSIDSWKSKKALQLPEYLDKAELESMLKKVESFPPLVLAGEARSLEYAAVGKAFLLQGGDCAESFEEFNANKIIDTFSILLQMSTLVRVGGQTPIKVGRIVGQFAMSQSDPFEEKDGVKLPSYRGDIINGDAFDEKSRIPDPNRMINAYSRSAAIVTLLRASAIGGYAAMP